MPNAASQNWRGPHIDPSECLLRLVWDSDDLDPDSGEISTSAFAKRDLMGFENGLSVDREQLAVKSVVLHLARKQQAKAEGNDQLNRTTALLARAITRDICAQFFDDDKQRIFAVIGTPLAASDTDPANPAHAEILNISGRTKNSELNKARIKLQPLFTKPRPIDDILQ